MQKLTAKRRLTRRMAPLGIAYVGVVAAATWVLNAFTLPTPAIYGIAFLISLPLVAMIFAMGRYVTEEDDEYIRMMFVRHMVTATGFTLVVSTVWGVVELFADAPAIPIYFVLVIWCLGLAISRTHSWLTS